MRQGMTAMLFALAHSAIRSLLPAILTGAAAVASCTTAEAQDFPNRPLRLVVGFLAGGPTDVPARFIADRLANALGKPVVVENRPGAGSMLAIQEMLAQQRDGHTLLACTTYDPVNTLLYRKARYKVGDIAPVTLIARYDYGIATRLNGPAETFPQLAAYAKANPGKLNYGILGVGSPQLLAGKKLEKLAGMQMTSVPYKGSNEAMQELVAGRLDMFMAPPLSVMPHVEAKQVKLIAATGPSRLSSAPDVPTLTELGVPIRAYAWLGICAGTGTPPAVIDFLNARLRPILEAADYKAMIERSGSMPLYSSPGEMQAMIDETVRDAAPTIEEFKVQLD
jgi:tripartite-type tricarboxylate transporter receptor subunit TctC